MKNYFFTFTADLQNPLTLNKSFCLFYKFFCFESVFYLDYGINQQYMDKLK